MTNSIGILLILVLKKRISEHKEHRILKNNFKLKVVLAYMKNIFSLRGSN